MKRNKMGEGALAVFLCLVLIGLFAWRLMVTMP
jgi:hypothetical protein